MHIEVRFIGEGHVKESVPIKERLKVFNFRLNHLIPDLLRGALLIEGRHVDGFKIIEPLIRRGDG